MHVFSSVLIFFSRRFYLGGFNDFSIHKKYFLAKSLLCFDDCVGMIIEEIVYYYNNHEVHHGDYSDTGRVLEEIDILGQT